MVEPLDVGWLIDHNEENTNLSTPANPHEQQHEEEMHLSKGTLRCGGQLSQQLANPDSEGSYCSNLTPVFVYGYLTFMWTCSIVPLQLQGFRTMDYI